MRNGNEKKPIFKKWWFWLIVVIVVVGVVGSRGSKSGDDAAPESAAASVEVTSTENNATSDEVVPEETESKVDVEETETTEEPAPEESETGSVDAAVKYQAGMYKIGTDMPTGEYLIESTGGIIGSTYIAVTSDSSGSLDSIIMNDNFYNRIYVTVSDGQYLSFASGTAISVADAAPFSAADGLYPAGMYLVGKDIPAGEYKISVEAGSTLGYGYYEIDSDSLGTLNSIVTNNNISSDTYQTLSDGQYLKMSTAYIQQ